MKPNFSHTPANSVIQTVEEKLTAMLFHNSLIPGQPPRTPCAHRSHPLRPCPTKVGTCFPNQQYLIPQYGVVEQLTAFLPLAEKCILYLESLICSWAGSFLGMVPETTQICTPILQIQSCLQSDLEYFCQLQVWMSSGNLAKDCPPSSAEQIPT
jgi:hypothetical protein